MNYILLYAMGHNIHYHMAILPNLSYFHYYVEFENKKRTTVIGKSFSFRLTNGYGQYSYQFPDTGYCLYWNR